MCLTCTQPGTGRMVTKPPALGSDLVSPAIPPLCPALAEGDSLAYLSVHRVSEEQPRFELGGIGHGPRGAALAQQICDKATVWDRDRDSVPHIAVYPVDHADVRAAAVKDHCAIVIDEPK